MQRRDFLVEGGRAALGFGAPAVSIAIIRDGQLAWRRAFGVKDTGTNEPVDVNTAFAACSDTKPVFAYGVLKLCEKGVLDLDTPLTKYTTRRILCRVNEAQNEGDWFTGTGYAKGCSSENVEFVGPPREFQSDSRVSTRVRYAGGGASGLLRRCVAPPNDGELQRRLDDGIPK